MKLGAAHRRPATRDSLPGTGPPGGRDSLIHVSRRCQKAVTLPPSATYLTERDGWSRQVSKDGRTAMDERLLQAVAARDEAALDQFFTHFFDRVYGYVARLLGDPTLAEDLTQESFLRMHRAIDRLDPNRDPAPWVFTVVANTVRDHWRSKHHRASSSQVDLEQVSPTATDDEAVAPDQELEDKEVLDAIQEALAGLSESDREVILLADYERLTSAQIGEMLDATPEAIRQRHSRALDRLGRAYRTEVGRRRGA
ncbi:MAG: sigma-70 family RNA polymerase sigma factor [Candidatus Eisenbacteria bacterium]|nr:sigma-70 family RNA polymerase sigma factor [Candidatus Latescibacterota bacterium]MBD3301444.1 sigma-70 family RNA polymerase sigma factor [Candidatus Eisenbacteria bacterium]